MGVEFRLLGDIEARLDGRLVDIGHARQRCVLAALLVDADRVVPVDSLLYRVWADRLTPRVRTTLSGYVSRLRHLLAPAVTLTHHLGGYRLAVDPMAVDLHRFRTLVTRARDEDAPELFAQALKLWRGEPFATLDTPWLTGVRAGLNAERHAAELARNEVALDRGQHASLLSELSTLAAAHPLDERLAGQLILALYRCGRQADALHHYDQLRQRLAEEVGADPGLALQQLYQRILTADPGLVVSRVADRPVPRQLPPAPRLFTGRAGELAALDAILDGTGDTPTAVVISAVSGTAGVGKTALALHWAHRVADRFADGQLYVNLRGFDPGGSVMSPTEAVRGFLDAFDVPAQRIPPSLEARTGLFRSLLAGKRVLVVLDNARDLEQLRPLLPGTPGCLVLVTSRNQLTGLVAAEGAHPLTLDLLSPTEARELLARHVGPERVAAEPDAVTEIITRCAHLPLALAIAAARAATRPTFPLASLAEELRDSRGRLDALADTDVRAVFSWSYETLSPAAARLFRLLGLHPGPDITVPAAASLAAVGEARPLLAELARANLLTELAPGRYTFHDLLRAYAAELANTHDTHTERRDATQRTLDHYLHTAHAANHLIDPHRFDPIGLSPVRAGVSPERLDTDGQAMGWFAAERPVLLAAIEHAASIGFEPYTWYLGWTLAEYCIRQGHWTEFVSACHTALRAAERVADPLGQACAHRALGNAYYLLGEFEHTGTHLRRALDLFAQGGDRTSQADCHRNIALLLQWQDHQREALNHAEGALALYRAAGNQVGELRALNAVGWFHALLGNYDKTLAYCQQAIDQHEAQQTGDRLGAAAAWDSLGYAHHHLGDYQRALACYQSSLDLFQWTGNAFCVADTLRHIADTHAATGHDDLARSAWQEALAILTALDCPMADEVRAKLESAAH